MKSFNRVGWFHVPTSVAGFFIAAVAVVFLVTVFKAVDRHSHSVSDTCYGLFPFFVCTFLLYDWDRGPDELGSAASS